MKFDKEKKNAIMNYIIEKISAGSETESLTAKVAEAFGINRNTVYTYINELVESGIITRVKRGSYESVKKEFLYILKRKNKDLDSDIGAYNNYLKMHVDEFASNVRLIWEYSFSEMINNVIDHSLAETATVIVKCDFLKTTVIISDDGVGIFEKIRSYFDYNTLEDAICELFKGKLTTDSANHSGEGIFFTSKIMDEFFILSDGKIFSNNKFEEKYIKDTEGVGRKGTTVYMTLSNNTKKELKDVFDAYSNVDGGFMKTTIPLKNVFDNSPVSRSQAKRICNRLESFQEVILDFEGMEWMGQGFAHQLFIVFKNNHPDIEIVPINMNEAVENMFRHVINTK